MIDRATEDGMGKKRKKPWKKSGTERTEEDFGATFRAGHRNGQRQLTKLICGKIMPEI